MTVRLADSIARFSADWRRSLSGTRTDPPPLAAYVPDESEARLAVLSDLVRIDIRHRWERPGLGKRITDYRTEFPEFQDSPELVDLLREEFVARRRSGPLPLEDFLAEYPDLADRVRAHLAATGADRIDANVLRIDRTLAEIAPGQRIDDFDLLTELGAAPDPASNRVFLARQRSMQRLVAVRLSTGGVDEPHTMARLDHPHIVRVFDHRMVVFADGAAFGRLVYMQYVPGGTAAEVLEQRGAGVGAEGGRVLLRAVDAAVEAAGEIRPSDSRVRAEIAALSWPETVAWIGRRLAEALDYAERHGVGHRALKPSNVLFTAEGVPKLADFMPERTTDDPGLEAPTVTTAYSSPEELSRALDSEAPELDSRADIYALGVLLWELLTGTLPFGGADSPAAALEQRRGGVRATALRQLPADCPAALRRVLLTCLEPEPHRRWSTGAVLAQQLDLCLDEHARDLVDPPQRSLRRHLRHWRVLLIALAIGVPNALASLYNIEHNRALIINHMSAEAQDRIDLTTAITNAAYFTVGAAVMVYFGRHLIFVPHGLRTGVRYSPETLHRARTNTIQFGDRALIAVFSMWMLSGVSFPFLLAGTGDEVPSAYAYAHYFVSHAICGAIALVYPFLLMNFYLIRCIYPMFLSHGEISARDAVLLHRLRRRCGAWMLGAAAIPLLSVASATLLVPADLAEIIVVLRFLAIGSVVAFLGVYVLFMALEKDLRALERVLAPDAGQGKP
ncbi:serine/threonine-protein kinase [Nocardia sp. NPDC050712]|uniref:serine/threonine-protein kinase n=1 Tax=Nocardia sp. NPDC050712 TaxID=3155518 RepID=UPI00340B2181